MAIKEILQSYNKTKITIATICSHTSLQIFHGAKKEGFRTLGIAIEKTPKFYSAFPNAMPNEFFIIKDYKEILKVAKELQKKNVIIIPHGSFVEYLGGENLLKMDLPTFGNRNVIPWEVNRKKQREWLLSAGLDMPKEFSSPKEINCPVMVKFHGAKGGKGYFIAKNYDEFLEVNPKEIYTIQEYITGTRYYINFFYSPIKNSGYKLSKGSLELLSIDRRDEANIDEVYKLGSKEELKKLGILPSFVVTGNVSVVLRESLLPKAFEMAENVVEKSLELCGGIIGPFCLETVVTDELKFKVFEISARIVAGTNPFIFGSPYSDLIEEKLSTGRRIAKEIKLARKLGRLVEIIS